MKILIVSSDLNYNFIYEIIGSTIKTKFNSFKKEFILHNIGTNSFIVFNIREYLFEKYSGCKVDIISSKKINRKLVEKPDACIFLYDSYDNLIPKYIEKFDKENCNLLNNTIIYRCIKRKDGKLIGYRINKLFENHPEVSFDPEKDEKNNRYDYSRKRLKDLGLLEE